MITNVGLLEAKPLVRARQLGGEISAVLLGTLGPRHLDTIVATVPEALTDIDPTWTDPEARAAIAATVTTAVSRRTGIQLITPLHDPAGDHRVRALLWATHGAFPPQAAEILVLSGLLLCTEREVGAVLRVPPSANLTVFSKVIRRSRALGVTPGDPAPECLLDRLRAASQRLLGLASRVAQLADTPWASSHRELIHHWLHLLLTHRWATPLDGIGQLRQGSLGALSLLGTGSGKRR